MLIGTDLASGAKETAVVPAALNANGVPSRGKPVASSASRAEADPLPRPGWTVDAPTARPVQPERHAIGSTGRGQSRSGSSSPGLAEAPGCCKREVAYCADTFAQVAEAQAVRSRKVP